MIFGKYYELLFEANRERRIEHLVRKYKDDKRLDKCFELFSFTFKTVEEFMTWIVNILDPTNGEYADWCVRNILKLEGGALDRFFREDHYKVMEDLEFYNKYKRYFKKAQEDKAARGIVIDLKKFTDINQIKDFQDLSEKNDFILDYATKEQEENTAAIEKAEMEKMDAFVMKVYDTKGYLIVIPKTQEAAIKYSKGTRWCTGATNLSYNRFNQYNERGPLYIIINKETQEKYQFHFRDSQYMDATDRPVNLYDFFDENREIKPFMLDLFLENEKFDDVYVIDKEFLFSWIDNKVIPNKSDYSGDDFGGGLLETMCMNNAFICYHVGKKEPELVNSFSLQGTFIFKNDSVDVETTATEFTDLIDFVGETSTGYRIGHERKVALSVLNGEYFDGYDNDNDDFDYDSDHFSWLNSNSIKLTLKYLKEMYPEEEAEDEDDIKRIVKENEDDIIISAIRTASSAASRSAAENDLYKVVIDAICDVFGKNYDFYKREKNKYSYIRFKDIKYNVMDNMMNRLETHLMESRSDFPITTKQFVTAYINMLDDEHELTIPDFDRAINHAYPIQKEDGEAFNEAYYNELWQHVYEKPENSQVAEEKLNINMTNFDEFLSIVMEGLTDMGNGGIANRAKGATPQPQQQQMGGANGAVGGAQQPMAGQQGTAGTKYAKNANPAASISQQAQANTNTGQGGPQQAAALSPEQATRYTGLAQMYGTPNFDTEFAKLKPEEHGAFAQFLLSQQQQNPIK